MRLDNRRRRETTQFLLHLGVFRLPQLVVLLGTGAVSHWDSGRGWPSFTHSQHFFSAPVYPASADGSFAIQELHNQGRPLLLPRQFPVPEASASSANWRCSSSLPDARLT